MYKNLIIKFVYHPYRKRKKVKEHKVPMSKYWRDQYNDMFKKW